jgi:hypothetical protein
LAEEALLGTEVVADQRRVDAGRGGDRADRCPLVAVRQEQLAGGRGDLGLGSPPSGKPITVYSQGTANIVAAMHRHGVKRLVTVSSSVMDPRWRPTGEFFFNNVLDPLVNRRLGRTAHEDMRRMEALVRVSELDWTIARPSGLFDHPGVTRYQVAEDVADGLFTARADLAASMVAQLADDTFVRRAMAVITTEVRPSIAGLIWREAIAKSK